MDLYDFVLCSALLADGLVENIRFGTRGIISESKIFKRYLQPSTTLYVLCPEITLALCMAGGCPTSGEPVPPRGAAQTNTFAPDQHSVPPDQDSKLAFAKFTAVI